MDAIICKYIGPTDTKGARYKAYMKGETGASITIGYDCEHADANNAMRVANALIAKLSEGRAHPFKPFWSMARLGDEYVYVNHSDKPWQDALCIDNRNAY
jgi:hypothetical protein